VSARNLPSRDSEKIFVADRDLPSIFAAYRIRRVREFVARPEAGFFVARNTKVLAALCFLDLENAYD
jgi:hypothetical protein